MDCPISECVHDTNQIYPTTPYDYHIRTNRSYSSIPEVRVKQQAEELNTLIDSINAVQRNFIRMSQKYAKEKKDHDELAEEHKKIMKEYDCLLSEKKLDAVVRAEFTELKGKYVSLLKEVEQQELERKTEAEQRNYIYNNLRDQEALSSKLREEKRILLNKYTRQGTLLSELQSITFCDVVSLLRSLEQSISHVFSVLSNELIKGDELVGGSVLSINGDHSCEESDDICVSEEKDEDEKSTDDTQKSLINVLNEEGKRQPESLLTSESTLTAPRSPERQTRRLRHLRGQFAALRNTQTLLMENDLPRILTAIGRQNKAVRQKSELDDVISQLKHREQEMGYQMQKLEREKLCIKERDERLATELNCLFQMKLQEVIQKSQNEKEILEAQLEEKARIILDYMDMLRFKTDAAEMNCHIARVTALQEDLRKHQAEEYELNMRVTAYEQRVTAYEQREKKYSEDLKEVIEGNKRDMKKRESEWVQLRLVLEGQISNQQAKQQYNNNKIIHITTEIQSLKQMLVDFKSEVVKGVSVMDNDFHVTLKRAGEAVERIIQQTVNTTSEQEARISHLEEEVLVLSSSLSIEKKEKIQIEKELEEKRDEIDSLSGETSSLKAKLASLDVDLRICKEELLASKINITTASERSSQILVEERDSLLRRITVLETSTAREIEGLHSSHQKMINMLKYENTLIRIGLEEHIQRLIIERNDEAKRRELQVGWCILTHHNHQFDAQIDILETLRNECLGTVKKLQAVEESCESGYSCQLCLAILRNPLSCAPCGHTFCRSCFDEANQRKSSKRGVLYCPECNKSHVTCVVPSIGLDLLVSKFEFRKNVLEDLMGVLAGRGDRCPM